MGRVLSRTRSPASRRLRDAGPAMRQILAAVKRTERTEGTQRTNTYDDSRVSASSCAMSPPWPNASA